jgi:peptidoglycan hydrolase-like protein with peptidoglycan-binding domain
MAEGELAKDSGLPATVIEQHAKEVAVKKLTFAQQIGGMKSGELKDLAKQTKVAHWQWASKDELATLFTETDTGKIAASKASIEAKHAKWAEKHLAKPGKAAQPVAKPVNVTPSVVKSAQERLADKGYNPGPADGVAGPQTRSALRKFQADQGLPETGRFDQPTLAKLDVAATQQLGSAPSDVGRGGKAFGHNIKEGHPVEAGKALGKGGEHFGKKVGEGAKSGAIGVKDKVGQGVSKVGDKLSGKSDDEREKAEPPSPK